MPAGGSGDNAAVVTLGTVREATGTAAVTETVTRLLEGRGWRPVEVRRRSVRLEPPDAYWAIYRVVIAPDPGPGAEAAGPGSTRELRLVARAVFDADAWSAYRDRLLQLYGGATCDPVAGRGMPILFDQTQHAIWFYPVDPNLPGLVRCAGEAAMRRLFRDHKREVLDRPARITGVEVSLQRWMPEIAAVLRYDIATEPAGAGRTVFGKVQHSGRDARSARHLDELWRVAEASGGRLRVPRPLGHHPELGLVLQSAVPGTPVGGDRTAPEFLPAAEAAAQALAVLHDCGLEPEEEQPVEEELERLDTVLDQFRLVHPQAHLMLRDLLPRIRDRLARAAEEEWVPTHGDLKYDQLVGDRGAFAIIDFDYFGMAETSFDLGKFCAHLVPSMPRGWEDSAKAEEARTLFLETYRELRPQATLQRFPAYEAINLANRAMVLMWSQLEGWEFAAETMLSLALERLHTPLP